jgi:hypothetical protein
MATIAEIEKEAYYRRDNWKEKEAKVEGFDVNSNTVSINGQQFGIVDSAVRQFYGRIGLSNTPKDFEDDKEFLQKAINRKLETQDVNQFIYDEPHAVIKAVMSTDYVRLPDYKVIEYAQSKGYNIDPRRSFITDNVMRLHTETVDRKETSRKGDIIGFGTMLFNGETGHSSLGASMSVLRLACTNGMLSRQALNVNRMAHRSDDLLSRLDKSIVGIYKPEEFLKVIDRAIASKPLLTNPVDLVEDVFKKYKLEIPQYHAAGIISQFEDSTKVDGGYNNYGVYNAITRYATHVVAQPEESHQIIYNAYKVLTL